MKNEVYIVPCEPRSGSPIPGGYVYLELREYSG